MLKRLVVRDFEDAVFVFDPSTQNSLFVEGTSSELVPSFLEDSACLIPSSYWDEIPDEYREQAKEEARGLRLLVQSFLARLNGNSGNEIGLPNDVTSESPMRKLSTYAVKNWQVVNVSIEMTYQCNLHCGCCYLSDHSQQGLSRRKLQKIAGQLKDAGAVFALFTGGETFLRGDIIEVMTDFKDHGFALEAKSNGLLLNQDMISRLANLHLFNLQVSVYGVDDGVTSFTGRPYPFKHLANNIREMIKQGLPLSLAVLVGKHNIDELDRYHETLQELGEVEVFYSPYLTPNRNGPGKEISLRLSRRDMDEKFYPFLEKIDGFVTPTRYRNRCKDSPTCYAGMDQISIDPQGTVFPCLDFRVPLGNLRKENLCQILDHRRTLLKPYKLGKISKCWGCPITEFCDSCVGTAILENGRFDEPSTHKCDISHFYHDSHSKRKEVKG